MTTAAAVISPRRPSPFLKWVGGKRRLISEVLARLPTGPIARYVEPFVGGGAVFFELAAQGRVERATLADTNEDLARAYLAVQRDCDAVIDELHHPAARYVYAEDDFYRIRALDPDVLSLVQAAARTIYLNKTCFNGLYRVNKSGRFNAPFGRYDDPTICDEEGLRAASSALQRARVRLADFEVVMDETKEGDVLYADPPYLPLSATSSFTAYTQDGFSLGDHERLRDALLKLRARGVRFALSNSAAPAILSLYDRREFLVERVGAARAINSDSTKRGEIEELLVAPTRVGRAPVGGRRRKVSR